MNRFLTILFFVLLVPIVLIAQTESQEKHYYFHLTTPFFETLKIQEKEDGTLQVTSLESEKETAIFNKYTLYDFRPAFPNTLKDNLKIVFRIVVNNPLLIEELLRYDPEKYYDEGQFFPTQNAYYPNDYGTTSPVENLGAAYPGTALDLINAPGAWGITTGDPKVVIGISDGKIDSTNIDLKGRVSNFLKYYDLEKGGVCAHGSGVAATIGAIMDNAYGIPGICSDCDMIANGYGNFDAIQELVEAGAKVINASWVTCGFGSYHRNIEERINEYYDEGILIVASAGNAKKCNRYLKDHASNYGYPASYEKVISVSMVFGECGHYEDCIIEDEQYGVIAHKLKDRHVKRYRMETYGKFDKLTPINTQWATQHNLSVDVVAPAESFRLGAEECGLDSFYAGLTSKSAPHVTGVIGLIWSVNYCLGSAEVESILKLTSADVENLPGNEHLKMKLGAGRIDAYKAVKMAEEMQLEQGIVNVSDRDFYRFHFELYSSPYQIAIKNQVFRDSATVNFKARKSIRLSNTKLSPDTQGFIKLSIDPNLPTEECFPKKPIPKPKVEKDSVYGAPRFNAPFKIAPDESVDGLSITPVEEEVDSDYTVEIKLEDEVIFKQTYARNSAVQIPLKQLKDQRIDLRITTDLKYMERGMYINREKPKENTNTSQRKVQPGQADQFQIRND